MLFLWRKTTVCHVSYSQECFIAYVLQTLKKVSAKPWHTVHFICWTRHLFNTTSETSQTKPIFISRCFDWQNQFETYLNSYWLTTDTNEVVCAAWLWVKCIPAFSLLDTCCWNACYKVYNCIDITRVYHHKSNKRV